MKNSMPVLLSSLIDRNGNVYHIGRVSFPGYIDCNEGVAFLVFLSESGEETLHISAIDSDNSTFSQYTKKEDRINLSINAKSDQNGDKFYVGKLQMRGVIDCRSQVTFLVYTSIDGSEQIQIICSMIDDRIDLKPKASSGTYRKVSPEVEVIVQRPGIKKCSI